MVSVVTWDASFRESYHTVDCFSCQTLNKNQFEFIWAEYYSSVKIELKNKILAMGNGKSFSFGGIEKWHLGKCLNAAIKESKGKLIVIPDGDIIVEENFLEEIIQYHSQYQNLVLYFRRWDEQKSDKKTKEISIDKLKQVCNLTNPANYGGCLTISRKCFDQVGGYEEHGLFSEAGANGKELYVRLKNAGFPIMWHPTHKIYHAWHEGTAPTNLEYKQKIELQNWVIQQRDLNCVCKADMEDVKYLVEKYRFNKNAMKNKQRAGSNIFFKINNFLRNRS